MSFYRRIRTIYRKELIDILRDRRTLIAMIVVPIVLYPLLMLGSIQAVSFQMDQVGQESIVIGVVDETHGQALHRLIELDQRAGKLEQSESEPAEELMSDWPKVNMRAFGSRERLEQAISNRAIHVGVILDSASLYNDPNIQNHIQILHDKEDVRSVYATLRIQGLFNRTGERTVEDRKRQANLPSTFDQPFLLELVDLSSPPSILGQILPLILILMTITGAIYPAIDLTAGERERGTLESLMSTPVNVLDLVVGKFLVVTTVAIMGATLNLASVTATVYFGGFDRVIATTGGALPIGTMVLILLCLIPFAVLMSAIMIAVCSFARTFKEAQNYVTPVILAVLIPGGIAALPATRLEGVMLVMPVGNMVLLARDLLLGAVIPGAYIAIVLLSTTLYAGAAVAVATSVFGHETVVFSDSGSLKRALSRSLMRPSDKPSVSTGLLTVALLFPLWFFVQSALGPGPDENASGLLYAMGWLMPLLFVVGPVAILLYQKVDLRSALSLRVPSLRYVIAALAIGATAWIPAHLLNLLQQQMVGLPESVARSAEKMGEALLVLPLSSVFVLIAIVPAISEELLFRGFLLASVGSEKRKWRAIVVSAAIFGVFHFFLFKFAVTMTLGVLLGYLCWQSRSIFPSIIAHLVHNAIGAAHAVRPEWFEPLGMGVGEESSQLPVPLMIGGGLVFLLGVVMTAYPPTPRIGPSPSPG